MAELYIRVERPCAPMIMIEGLWKEERQLINCTISEVTPEGAPHRHHHELHGQ